MKHEAVFSLIFPPKCGACRKLLDWHDALRGDAALCGECQRKWDSEALETCGHCARPVTLCECMPSVLKKVKCRSLRKLIYYRHGLREPVQNRIIYRIKETRDRRVLFFLAQALLPAVREILETNGIAPDDAVLAYVPRGRRARLMQGTDQARELARALSRLSGIPCKRLLRRCAEGEQKKLDAGERHANAMRAFGLVRAARSIPETVLLVDDIVTTGESMAACTRLLRMAGAGTVFALSIASDDHNQ